MDVIGIKGNTKITNELPHFKPNSSIFSLNVDCLEMIFDFLSLEDVCSIGRTCRGLRDIAGDYFYRVYSSKPINFAEQPMVVS